MTICVFHCTQIISFFKKWMLEKAGARNKVHGPSLWNHRCISGARWGAGETHPVIRGPFSKLFTSCTDRPRGRHTKQRDLCDVGRIMHRTFLVTSCLYRENLLVPLPCGMSPDRQWGGAEPGLPQAIVLSSTHTRTMLQTSKRLLLTLKILKLG